MREARLLEQAATLSSEDIPLVLPSALPALRSSINRIVSAEARLREAQADDALAELCRVRRVLPGLMTFKKYNLAGEGNKANTRVRAVHTRLQAALPRDTGYRGASCWT
jgi:hypothetical protein